MRSTLTGLLVTAATSFGMVTATQVFATSQSDEPERAAKPATRVTVAPPMVQQLRRAGIDMRAIKPAKATEATEAKGHPAFRLPIARQREDLVTYRGGLALVKSHQHHKHHAKATRLRGDYDNGRVSALINGSDRKYLFNARRSGRPGLGNVRLVLTRYAAGSLNKTFHTKQFEAGDTFGYAKLHR